MPNILYHIDPPQLQNKSYIQQTNSDLSYYQNMNLSGMPYNLQYPYQAVFSQPASNHYVGKPQNSQSNMANKNLNPKSKEFKPKASYLSASFVAGTYFGENHKKLDTSLDIINQSLNQPFVKGLERKQNKIIKSERGKLTPKQFLMEIATGNFLITF